MESTRNALLGCPNGSVHGDGPLLELDELLELGELLLELDRLLLELGELLELDRLLLELDRMPLELDKLLVELDTLLLELEGVLLLEFDDSEELLDLDDDELLDGGTYRLLELRYELDELLPGGTTGGVGLQGGAHGGAQLGG